MNVENDIIECYKICGKRDGKYNSLVVPPDNKDYFIQYKIGEWIEKRKDGSIFAFDSFEHAKRHGLYFAYHYLRSVAIFECVGILSKEQPDIVVMFNTFNDHEKIDKFWGKRLWEYSLPDIEAKEPHIEIKKKEEGTIFLDKIKLVKKVKEYSDEW